MLARKLLIGISLAALAAGSASAQSNSSTYSQTGSNNEATVDNTVEGNIGNASVIIQDGVSNSATVFQRELFNNSFIQQAGVLNTTSQQQSGTSNNADTRQNGDFNSSYVAQVGESSLVNVVQLGFYTDSVVLQGYAADESVPGGEFRAADFNEASVDQSGAGLQSRISQRSGSVSAPAASDNVAEVLQRSSGGESGIQQASEVTQESRGNFASVQQLVGSLGAPNSSIITQRNSGAGAENPLSGNSATVLQEGLGLDSELTQDGFDNVANVAMRGGGAGPNEANESDIAQVGRRLAADANFGRLVGRGTGNALAIAQQGDDHSAVTYQFGIADEANVTQENGVNVGAYPGGFLPRAEAFISQNGNGFTGTIVQSGDNYGEITQGLGSGSRTALDQRDAGDSAGAPTRNSAIITQYGDVNSIDVDQDALAADAIVWQKVGSTDNRLEIAQGEGRTGLSSTTATPGFAGGPTGAGSVDLEATVTQAGRYNNALVYQDGLSLTANVEQNGTGSDALRNIAFISQTGSGNSARAFQASGVGPSTSADPASGHSSAQNGGAAADEFFFAGGARSAELAILQTSTGNSATIEQYGRGQFARIEQSGPENVATIIQEATATNATAVIRQSGDNNTYAITQSTAGQYIVVSQTGSNNTATNVVTRP